MAPTEDPNETRKFSAPALKQHGRRQSQIANQDGLLTPSLKILFMGISAVQLGENKVAVSLAAHDTTYLVDFSVEHLELQDDVIGKYVVNAVQKYEKEHYVKIIGAGLPTTVAELSPTLCSCLWLEVDIIPMIFRPDYSGNRANFWDAKHVDEQADSMARKCVM